MAEKEVIETSEAEIAVHWGEEKYYHPSTEFLLQTYQQFQVFHP